MAGEPSGDLHASNLVKDLTAMRADLRFFGLGGALLKNAGADVMFDTSCLALIGATEVIKNLSTVKRAYDSVISKIDSIRPDMAILVDYPGFNLRLAKELKKRAIPVVYYISPQVWAWGRGRVNIIKKCVKKMIVFFKFEEELYKTYDIDVEFVGHPLLDTVKASLNKDWVFKKYDLDEGKTTIALLAGSRIIEVKALLATMLASAKIIKNSVGNAQFIIAKHPDIPMDLFEEVLRGSDSSLRIAVGDTYNVLAASDLAIVASGSATLEAAIVGTPHIIIYKTSLLTYLAYKIVATTPFVGLVNIIAGKEVVPELLQYEATPQNISDKVVGILSDEGRLTTIRKELSRVKSALGAPGASRRAASAILPLLG